MLEKNNKITGYSLYNPIMKQRIKENPLQLNNSKFPQLPNKKFDVIYADPPWNYNGKMQFDNSLVKTKNINYKNNIFISSACFKYPTMKLKDLLEIPIKNISQNNCILFMWSTSPHMKQAIQLGEYWGFEYKTVAFVWNKMNHNPGQYTLSYCELCLLFKRGKIPLPRGARNIKQLINTPRKKHSLKPQEVRVGIEKMFPEQSKIELFARQEYKNWESWGLESH